MFVIADHHGYTGSRACGKPGFGDLLFFFFLFLPYPTLLLVAMRAIRRKFSRSNRPLLPYMRPAQEPLRPSVMHPAQRSVCISGLVEWFARLMPFFSLGIFWLVWTPYDIWDLLPILKGASGLLKRASPPLKRASLPMKILTSSHRHRHVFKHHSRPGMGALLRTHFGPHRSREMRMK